MPTFRVAILECDTPLDKVLNKYGSYGDIFTALLQQASKEVTAEVGEQVQVECTNYDVVDKQEYPEDLETVDAVLMTGSSKFCLSASLCLSEIWYLSLFLRWGAR